MTEERKKVMMPPVRILHLEDNPNDAELLYATLTASDLEFTPTRVETRADFLAALDRGGFDLILCDYSLPSFNGKEALALTRAKCPEVPFIFASGTIGEDNAVEALKAGATDYVLKDRAARLGTAIRRALQDAALQIECKRAEAAMRESEIRHRLVTRATNDAIWDWNLEKNTVWWNDNIRTLFGYTEDAVSSDVEWWNDRVHPDDRERVNLSIHRVIDSGEEQWLDEYRFRRANGEYAFVADRGYVSRDDQGHPVRMIGSMADITERKQAEERIMQLAYYDQLTGLANRTLLQERLQHELQSNSRLPLALLMMDLTRFTEINDTLGHRNGDLLLQEVGQRLKDTLPEAITIARTGNDTFAVLLLRTSEDDAGLAAQTIIEALATPFALQGLSLEISAHLGIAIAPDHGRDAPTLLRRAEVAMGVAKTKECSYTIYSAEADPYRPELLTFVSELRQAIHNGQLLLHYQPKIKLATGEVSGVEALVRWQHPQRGLVPPAQFIPLAEQTGLIKPLTEWAFEAAARQILRWQDEGLRLTVAVNLSARNLQDAQVADQVLALLERSGLSPEQLVLEITESMIMADPAHALEQLTRFKRMGIKLAIDDFGTGYSSLAYLKKLPVHELKIDRAFIKGLMSDRNDAAIVRAATDIARNLGLKVVEEGIEDKQTWHGLVALGCDEGQGHFISKPLPADELSRWLRDYTAKLPV